MNEILEIAKEAQFNEKSESQAVFDYTEFLKKIVESNIDKEIKDIAIDTITEIISDELNHQMKLGELYVLLTGIEPNKN